VLARAERLLDASQVDAAVTRIAVDVTARLADRVPLVVAVMGGGVVFAGQLLPRLAFPLEFDYVHASRYRGSLRGGEIEFHVTPRTPLAGRTILLLDDILDEGHTLAAIRSRFLFEGASEVVCAVFCEKQLAQSKPVHADFVGVTVPDRYVFGFGMDVRGAWRNLPEVFACRD